MWHPAIAQALTTLAVHHPVSIRWTRRVLVRVLRGTARSPCPERAWSFSELTYDGFPLEFVFVGDGDRLRYTLDVGGPDMPPARRLACAMDHISALGSALPSPRILARLEALQRGRPLRYGAWLGIRQGVHDERYKLYLEAAAPESTAAAPLIREHLGGGRWLPDRPCRLRLVGLEPATSRLEFYFRGIRLQPYHIRLLLERGGFGEQHPELITTVNTCLSQPQLDRWPIHKIGFSYALTGQGVEAFSLFVPACKLFGTDSSIRRRLLALALQCGWSLSDYADLSAPLADTKGSYHHHGMIGFTVTKDQPLQVSIGLRPPGKPAPATGKPV